MDKFVVRLKRNPELSTTKKVLGVENTPSFKNRGRARFNEVQYVNPSNGHQKANASSSAKTYWEHRHSKLALQAAAKSSKILQGIKIYVNGLVGVMDDLEFRKLVQSNGGEISMQLSQRTVSHMICTSLCGKKSEKAFMARTSALKVVRPEWVIDSVKNGKRLPESGYKVLSSETQKSANDIIYEMQATT
ncbi:hypothetical protein HDU85_007415 [Gaertneriomyces sp. JEL0708]|nr:hypothetical protein HDU85_007415 [Gaertneriomyces sp. JEL0708]